MALKYMKGCDISHYQTKAINSGIINLGDYDFVILKATEGKTYKDKDMPKLLEKVKTDLIGFYHFARPEKYGWKEEADNFIKAVKPYINNGAILALDWEDKAVKLPVSQGVEWALNWLRYVEQQTGIKPMIYCSEWYCKNLKRIYENGNGLWIARYPGMNFVNSGKKPSTGVYPFFAMWQYNDKDGNKEIDVDFFNGKRKQFEAYMGRK